jgi:hypothetical protein
VDQLVGLACNFPERTEENHEEAVEDLTGTKYEA